MHRMKPLPGYLVQRYCGQKATTFEENADWYRNLPEAGQHSRTMVISCYDSQVPATAIFGADGAITDIGEGHLSVYEFGKGFQQL